MEIKMFENYDFFSSKNSHSVVVYLWIPDNQCYAFHFYSSTTATQIANFVLILRLNKLEMFGWHQSTLFNDSVPYVVPVPLDKSVCSLWIDVTFQQDLKQTTEPSEK